jgi:hypothetical protein
VKALLVKYIWILTVKIQRKVTSIEQKLFMEHLKINFPANYKEINRQLKTIESMMSGDFYKPEGSEL